MLKMLLKPLKVLERAVTLKKKLLKQFKSIDNRVANVSVLCIVMF